MQCSGAQLTALLATATLPSPGGALGPAAPQAGAARSSRHSHLFFSQTAITLRIRKQPTKAFCLLCLNSYKDTNECQPFPGASWRNQGSDPSVPTQEKAPLRPVAWAQQHGALEKSRASPTRQETPENSPAPCLKAQSSASDHSSDESYLNENDFVTWGIWFKQNLQQRLQYLFSEVLISEMC